MKLVGRLLFGLVATLLAGVAIGLVAISHYSSEPTRVEEDVLIEMPRDQD